MEATQNPKLISLVIPVLRDEDMLQKLLAHVGAFDLHEILIVDADLAQGAQRCGEAGYAHAKRLSGPLGRGAQIAMGIKAAQGDYIWVLHADSLPHAQSVQAIKGILENPDISLGCFHLRFDDPHPLLRIFEWGARLETRLTTFGDQGFFFRRQDYMALGIDLEGFPLLEDTALRKGLVTRGKVRKSRLPVLTSARRFRHLGVVRTQIRNMKVLLRFALGTSPQDLYMAYYSKSKPAKNGSTVEWPQGLDVGIE